MWVFTMQYRAPDIRRGKRDNLGIISYSTPLKRMLQPIIRIISPETVLTRGHKTGFRLEIRKIIFELFSILPIIWNSVQYAILILPTYL